ncbi:hypothetical protein EPO15_16500, partial [bacterium]
QAEIGISQLALLPQNLAWRRRAAEAYREALGGAAPAQGPEDPAADVHLRFTFLVDDRRFWEDRYRDVLDMGVWFTSVAQGRDTDLELIGYESGSCPVAEMTVRRCVNLPTHQRITRPELLAGRLKENLRYLRGGTER